MNPKSGTAGNAVDPTAPATPEEADLADPGQMAEFKAEQKQTHTGKYGSEKSKPFKPADAEDEEAEEGSWIEVELVGEDDRPVPGEKYRIELSDGRVDEGTLDNKGFVRLAGIPPGDCKISFPNLDKDAWEPI